MDRQAGPQVVDLAGLPWVSACSASPLARASLRTASVDVDLCLTASSLEAPTAHLVVPRTPT